MKKINQINSALHTHLWLFAFASTRSILDVFWVPQYRAPEYWGFDFFNAYIYLYTLYLLIPALATFFLEKIFSQKTSISEILQQSVLVWIIFPFVTIISLITKSPASQTIPWFKYIPTFMVYNNFLPTGMLAVIPILIVFYTQILSRQSKTSLSKALLSVLMSLTVVYLLYYQYTLVGFYYFFKLCGPYCSFGFYNMSFLLALFPLASQFASAFKSDQKFYRKLVSILIIAHLGMMLVGFMTNFNISFNGGLIIEPKTKTWLFFQ